MVGQIGQGKPNPTVQRLLRDGQNNDSFAHEALQFVPDLFIGAGEAALSMAKGIGTLVFHPIQTAKGLAYLATKLVTEPGPTVRLLGHALVDPYVEEWQSGHPGRAIGMGIVDVGSLFVTPSECVSVARGGAAFATAAVHGVTAGEGVGLALKDASVAAEYSFKATNAARDAERLAQLGHSAESSQMALYAKNALRVSVLARGGRATGVARALAMIAPERTVTVAGTAMTYGDFLGYSQKLLGWNRFTLLSGRVPRGVYTLASDAREARAATKVAEQVLAGGKARPSLLAEVGRSVMRNPQFLAPATPAIGLVPSTLGRIGALPKDLPTAQALTPAVAAKIAEKYHLADSLDNVQAFVNEVSGYQGNSIGPDTSTTEQIQELQALLQVAGYSVTTTGKWDIATSDAVIAFKRANGIHQNYKLADGTYAVNEYADSHTIDLLLNKVNDVTLKNSVATTLKPTHAPVPQSGN